MATYKSKRPYLYGTGRRKSSVARVHLIPGGTGAITINGRDIDEYFGLDTLKLIVRQPLVATATSDKVDIEATVSGGGVTGQAGAIRHGIARALLLVDESYRATLKAAGYLTRDPRMKERKKYGLKAARRAPQFSKRLSPLISGKNVQKHRNRPVSVFFYLLPPFRRPGGASFLCFPEKDALPPSSAGIFFRQNRRSCKSSRSQTTQNLL